MKFLLQNPWLGQKILTIFLSGMFSVGIMPLLANSQPVLAVKEMPELVIFQGNSLISAANPNNPEPKVLRKIMVIATAYSSTVWQTDDTPHITASGTWVKDGTIANNILPFGTRVRIPELYGDKIFIVEDRMSRKKGNNHIDIWFPEYWQAKNFGAKTLLIEILES